MADSVFEGEGTVEASPVTEEKVETATDGAATDEVVTSNAVDAADGEGANAPDTGNGEEAPPVDYEAVMREDLAALKAAFPELEGLGDLSELTGALRYAALRDMGLSAVEAYMAACAPRTRRDSRAHLSATVRGGAGAPHGAMTHGELTAARELFSGLSDAEIHSLYKRVNG